MSKSPADMVKQVPKSRTGAFNDLDRQSDVKQEKSPERSAQKVEDDGKLKTKLSDYKDEVIKKTSVELPLEVMKAWTVDCAKTGVSKREHLLTILTRDLNKRR